MACRVVVQTEALRPMSTSIRHRTQSAARGQNWEAISGGIYFKDFGLLFVVNGAWPTKAKARHPFQQH